MLYCDIVPNGQNQRRINYALAATMIAAGATLADVCPRVGAKNPNTLRVGLSRRGVTIRNARVVPVAPGEVTTVTARLAAAASEGLRDILAGSALKAAESLALAKPGRTVKQIRAYAETLEPLSRVGDRIHGWSNQASAPTFNVLVLGDKPCGVDTPTGGVPHQIADSPTPQVEQVTDVQEVASPS